MQYSIEKRPRLLSQIKGQDSIIKDLMKRQMNYKWPNAMLMRGLYGTGKTTTAMAVALALQCSNSNDVGEPCRECASCKSIIEERYDRDTHMLDGALVGNKDAVTDMLDLVGIAPMQDPKRLFIIEEANKLSSAAIDTLHKVLENPRKNVHFLLLSMDTGKPIPPSIQSRCQVYNFKPFTVKDTMLSLKEIMIEEGVWDSEKIPNSFRLEGLATISNASKGSFRDALQYLERCLSGGFYTPEDIRDNLGIVDESSVHKMIASFLDRDESAWFDLMRIDPNEIYKLLLTIVTNADLYRVTGIISNEIFASSIKGLAGHPSFVPFHIAIDSLRESSKNYLRKSDLIQALIDFWKSPVNSGVTITPVEKRVGVREKNIPTRKRRGD